MGKYDAQVKRLTERPETILRDWCAENGMFSMLGPSGFSLTMIKSGYDAPTDEIKQLVIKSRAIPADARKIKVAHLPAFAALREKIDGMMEANVER
jgi:hypothetical protein